MIKYILLLIIAVTIIGGTGYWRNHIHKGCITYYDKTGTKIIFKECK